MLLRLIVIYIVFIFCGIESFGQFDTLQFRQLTIENGLSHNLVNNFIQDKNGFLWVATQNGISRYDGYSFKIYKTDSKHYCGLLSSDVKTFLIDKRGNFWVGTSGGGLHRYDYDKDIFISYAKQFAESGINGNLDIYGLTEGADGSLWIGTYGDGVVCFNSRTQIIKQYVHSQYDSTSLSSNDVRSILMDSHQRLWVGTDGGGLNMFSVKTNNFVRFTAGSNKNSLRNNVVMSLCEDSEGDIWLGTYGGGVHRIKYGVFPVIQRFASDNYRLSNAIVWQIKEIGKKQLWFATRGAGIFVCNKDDNSESCVNIRHQEDSKLSLSSNMILALYLDYSGVVWIGTENTGIVSLNSYQNKFRHSASCQAICSILRKKNVTAITKDSLNRFWIGTANAGVYSYDPAHKSANLLWQHSFFDQNDLRSVFSIVADKQGVLWFGTDGKGLISYDPKTGRRRQYRHKESDTNSLSNDAVHDVYLSRKGIFWLGTYGGGLCSFNPRTEIFKTYPVDDESMKNAVLAIHEDYSGQIWVGTGDKGLARLNTDGSFTFYQTNPNSQGAITSNRVWSITQTSDKRYLWIGTDGGGFCRMNLATEFITVWNEADGLANDVVTSLLVDKRENIWIGTLHGLSRFSPLDNSFQTFTKHDGLTNNQFNYNAAYCNDDGKVIFGGIDGTDGFYPDSICFSDYEPSIHITSLSVGNQSVGVGQVVKDAVLLNKSITETDELRINYTHTIVSLEFAAFDFRSPNSIRYAYKLEGVDDRWVEVDASRRYVTYTQLPAGEYEFKVKSTNSDGVWNKNVASLKITVVPPFWRTLWFLVFIVVLFLLIVYGLFRIRVYQLKRSKQELERAVADQTEELVRQSGQILLQNEEILDKNDLLEQQRNELEEHRKNLEIMVSIRTDELRQALDRAQEADLLKTAFLTNMSHEIRTPMNTIIGFADMLSLEGLAEEKRKKYISQIYKHGEALVRIIDDIIDISKIQTGQVCLSRKMTHLGQILANASIYTEDSVQKSNKKLTTVLKTPDALNTVVTFTDEYRVMQVLINLISNAVKYTDTGQIEFGAEVIIEKKASFVRFFVSDTGRGISEEQKNYVFKSFSKINSRERHYSGAGLGLCISQNIVEMLGGTIGFEPNLPQGTTFFFTIPIIQEDDHMDVNRINWKNKKILIMEDDEVCFMLLKEMLSFDGVEILWAENGAIGVDMFIEHKPSVIFVDLRMPDLDGYQVLSAIRQVDHTIPIIAQSAFALYSERDRIIEAGFSDLLSKPVNLNALYAVLYRLFKDDLTGDGDQNKSFVGMMI